MFTRLLLVVAFLLGVSVAAGEVASAGATSACTIYVTNFGSSSVSVIDGDTNTVTDTIPSGFPYGVAVAPSGTIFITNFLSGSVSVIDGLTDAVTATVTVGSNPLSAATSGCPSPSVVAVVDGDGRSIQVSGTDFPPSTAVTITLGSVTLGTATTEPDGSFDATFIEVDCTVTSGELTATAGAVAATTNVVLSACTPAAPAFTG